MQGATQACQGQGISFLLVALEAIRGLHRVTQEQVQRIGAALGGHQGVKAQEAVEQLFRVPITLMQGNIFL